MRVFARFIESDGFQYRLDTLLQFRDSWDLIGNIVLANPGSAEPMDKDISKSTLLDIERFWSKYGQNAKFYANQWFEFKPDSTMRCIEKLFSGFYTHGTRRQLNGVISLSNCFNARNQNLRKAIKNLDKYKRELAFTYQKIHFIKPVYFGFSQAVLDNKKLRDIAKQIFDKTPQNLKSIYNKDFNKNKFYHLGYINRAYTNKARQYTNEVLFKFVETLDG
ncbi:MAG: hypothetical protein PUB96_04600 [Helicobacteraceae bacterium]|nr:hypothetical protein [Helicobacteraceae bacterium]